MAPLAAAAQPSDAVADTAPAPAPASAPERGAPIVLRASPTVTPPPRGEAGRQLPIILRAQSLQGRPDLEAVAEGNAEFRRGGLVIRADRVSYDQPSDLAIANGAVHINRDGNAYSGPELQLQVQRFAGFFVNPVYFFGRTGAGGRARRVDFLDEQRSVATDATYTSCLADGGASANGATGASGPAWQLTTDRVQIDFSKNEGIADGAVLRFYGVPILAAPRLSFPLTDARKSGWLPPSIVIDSKSGLQSSIPYYWNIAPNRDATLTPAVSTRRGTALDSEFRYLEPNYAGAARWFLMPNDLTTGVARHALDVSHSTDFNPATRLDLRLLRVSDNAYWKDFPGQVDTPTPRLLGSSVRLSHQFGLFGRADEWDAYARMQRWQVLQTVAPSTRIDAPYERAPQLGVRHAATYADELNVTFETEFNRFLNPSDGYIHRPRITGSRVHALGTVSRSFITPGWRLTPKLALHGASYALDEMPSGVPIGAARAARIDRESRVIPTVSVDSAWVLERDTEFFARAVRQTLEPRLLYVNTPFREQRSLPNFDAAEKDLNFDSIFTENAFSGVDRVSDSHHITAGVTTRVLDADTGAEAFRLGLAQRHLLRDQRITLQPNGRPDVPIASGLRELLLLGSTTLIPSWTLDASVQYSPANGALARSVIGARYSPGPFRTLSATHRRTRGLSEQVELGWQWPVYGPTPLEGASARSNGGAGGACQGSWYAVGRINFSTLERRITELLTGMEYDAGCWIGRVIAARTSTGLSEATTRLMVQLELVGLSRLGSNPLQSLKDNIPGYRLLRDERAPIQPLSTYE